MKCSSCKGNIILSYKTGDYVCSNCGLIVEKMMVQDSSIRNGERIEKTLLTSHDKGLGTVVGGGFENMRKRKLNPKGRKRAARLSFVQKRSRTKNQREKNVRGGLMLMARLKSQFQVPQKVLDESAYLFRKYIHKKGKRETEPIKRLILPIFYCAIRRNGIPISMKEYEKDTGIKGKFIRRMVRRLKGIGYDTPLLKPQDFLFRYASLLDLNERIANKAREFLDKGFVLQTINPSIVAAGTLYYFANKENKRIAYAKISQALDISEPSLRSVVHKIREEFG